MFVLWFAWGFLSGMLGVVAIVPLAMLLGRGGVECRGFESGFGWTVLHQVF
jgi:hypothetical protein